MVVINGYLERDNDKFFKLHMNNSSVFEMEFSSFKHRPLTLWHEISAAGQGGSEFSSYEIELGAIDKVRTFK